MRNDECLISKKEGIDIERIREITKDFPWKTRREYRELRRNEPYLGLPSDNKMTRIFGSFSDFSTFILNNNDSESEQNGDIEGKDEIIYNVLSLMPNASELTRDEYRRHRKNSQNKKKLPSCDKIGDVFGSFREFKSEAKKIMDSLGETKYKAKDLENTHYNQTRQKVLLQRYILFGSKRNSYEWEPESRKETNLFHFV